MACCGVKELGRSSTKEYWVCEVENAVMPALD
jgi:hypothetical protein